MKLRTALRAVAASFLYMTLACGKTRDARPEAPPPQAAAADDAGPVDPSTAARIARIERGLLPPVVFEGEPVVDMTIAARLAHYEVPAVSVAVVEAGRIAWARSYGVTEAGGGVKATTGTLFQACSISKPVAAVTVLRAVQDGKLALDEDVNARLTSWHVPETPLMRTHAGEKKVTLRRILSHSAGLTVHGFDGYAAGEKMPALAQILDGSPPANSAPIRVDLEPGSEFRYAGGGYVVAQQLLEDVLHRPFADVARDTVLRPLGMSHSTFAASLPPDLARIAAVGHRESGRPLSGKWHGYPELAAAGLWTTPSDLARFAIGLQAARRGSKSAVLAKEVVAEMLTPQLAGFGLGLFIEGEGKDVRFMHTGANEGYRSILVASAAGDRDVGVVVMSNGDGGGGLDDEIVRAVAREYGIAGYEVKSRRRARIDLRSLAALAGRYAISPDFVLTVTVEGDHLMVENSEGQKTEVFPASETEFFYMIFDAQLTFAKDGAGRVGQVVLHQRGQDRVGTRLSK